MASNTKTSLLISIRDAITSTCMVPHPDQKLGSDCSGTDGIANRVLTLTNTVLTGVVIVFVDASAQHEGAGLDYTVSHLAASSTITFLHKVWDAQNIRVIYFV